MGNTFKRQRSDCNRSSKRYRSYKDIQGKLCTARLAGYDWSDSVSLSSFYSYGYSLILLPVFVLCKDAVVAYRAALFVNFVLLVVCFFILQKMGKRFYAAVSVFYPTWLFYAGTTFAEILLVMLYVVTCLLLLKYFQTGQKRFLVLMLAAMLYMYFVHMRAIGVLVTGIAVLVLYSIKMRWGKGKVHAGAGHGDSAPVCSRAYPKKILGRHGLWEYSECIKECQRLCRSG